MRHAFSCAVRFYNAGVVNIYNAKRNPWVFWIKVFPSTLENARDYYNAGVVVVNLQAEVHIGSRLG
jgi:hypothetical protein